MEYMLVHYAFVDTSARRNRTPSAASLHNVRAHQNQYPTSLAIYAHCRTTRLLRQHISNCNACSNIIYCIFSAGQGNSAIFTED